MKIKSLLYATFAVALILAQGMVSKVEAKPPVVASEWGVDERDIKEGTWSHSIWTNMKSLRDTVANADSSTKTDTVQDRIRGVTRVLEGDGKYTRKATEQEFALFYAFVDFLNHIAEAGMFQGNLKGVFGIGATSNGEALHFALGAQSGAYVKNQKHVFAPDGKGFITPDKTGVSLSSGDNGTIAWFQAIFERASRVGEAKAQKYALLGKKPMQILAEAATDSSLLASVGFTPVELIWLTTNQKDTSPRGYAARFKAALVHKRGSFFLKKNAIH